MENTDNTNETKPFHYPIEMDWADFCDISTTELDDTPDYQQDIFELVSIFQSLTKQLHIIPKEETEISRTYRCKSTLESSRGEKFEVTIPFRKNKKIKSEDMTYENTVGVLIDGKQRKIIYPLATPEYGKLYLLMMQHIVDEKLRLSF